MMGGKRVEVCENGSIVPTVNVKILKHATKEIHS